MTTSKAQCGREKSECPYFDEHLQVIPGCRTCIVFAQDYERDLKHEDGREWDESWLGKLREEEDRRRYD